MRKTIKYPLEALSVFKENLLSYSRREDFVCVLDHNEQEMPVEASAFDMLVAIGAHEVLIEDTGYAFEALQTFHDKHQDWLFGYLSYELKNELEALHSANHDGLDSPDLLFFVPKFVLFLSDNELHIHLHESLDEKDAQDLIDQILDSNTLDQESGIPEIKPRISKEAYLESIKNIQSDIKRGEIYELNFCQEFYAEDVDIVPERLFMKLNEISQAPFSVYFKAKEQYLLSASPERFLKKTASRLISQPIKGTRKRGRDLAEDLQLKQELYNDPKERSENVMIVDLVRNDLSKTAKKGTVKVDELFGVYSYLQVHQMISTVSAELSENYTWVDAIKAAFPMGSMTGAPKVRAMELIEQYESTKRALYSGAVGYVKPNGDFDFNVVIRSILYNKIKNYLSFMVGGAIIMKADADKEYDECMLKAQAMFNVLSK